MSVVAGLGVVLAGCGDDDDGGEDPYGPIDSQGDPTSGWSTQIDPVTGREFRCLVIRTGERYDGTAVMHCYEPAEGEI